MEDFAGFVSYAFEMPGCAAWVRGKPRKRYVAMRQVNLVGIEVVG
jgi:hypothetical protein